MLENMTVLTADTFQSYTADRSCLVLVFRRQCPHCRVLMAVVDKCRPLCPDLPVTGVDADESPGILDSVGVTKVPTILVYRNGHVSGFKSGVMNPSELLALVASSKA